MTILLIFLPFSINFNRIIPKSNMFKSSEVLTYLNDEAIQRKEEMNFQNDSAFLQRSKKSISESEESLEEKSHLLFKDEKLYGTPEEFEELPHLKKCDKTEECRIEQKDIDIAHPVEFSSDNNKSGADQEDGNIFKDSEYHHKKKSDTYEENVITSNILDCHHEADMDNMSHEDISKQISNIQNQILKLSNLPSIIQTAIDDISKQVLELMPAIQDNRTINSKNPDVNVHDDGNSLEPQVQRSQNQSSISFDQLSCKTVVKAEHQTPNEKKMDKINELQELQEQVRYSHQILHRIRKNE